MLPLPCRQATRGDGDDGAELIVDVTRDFDVRRDRSWAVPSSDRYPNGVKYSMQSGTADGEIVVRYDNFPDHPGAAHHRHLPNGGRRGVEAVPLADLETLYERFKTEVRNRGENW